MFKKISSWKNDINTSELLVVFFIIGLFLVLAVPSYNIFVKKAEAIDAVQTSMAIHQYVVEYFESKGEFPKAEKWLYGAAGVNDNTFVDEIVGETDNSFVFFYITFQPMNTTFKQAVIYVFAQQDQPVTQISEGFNSEDYMRIDIEADKDEFGEYKITHHVYSKGVLEDIEPNFEN